jgi:integrase/recombinase XerD
MEDAIQNYLLTLGSQNKSSGNTLGAYRTDLRQLVDYLSERDISDWGSVTPEIVADFIRRLDDRQYASTSIARKVAAMKSFFRYLQVSGIITDDPAYALQAPRVTKYLPHALHPDEMQHLFDAIDTSTTTGQRDHAMIQTIYSTGMRVTELISLDLSHVDLARGHVRCNGRNQRERVLPLALSAQRALATYMEDGRRELLRERDETALFLNHHGERLTRQGFWLIIKSYARAAGISDITPHTLRHSFAVDMLSRGMELRSVQQLLGHASVSTTHIYKQLRRGEAVPVL